MTVLGMRFSEAGGQEGSVGRAHHNIFRLVRVRATTGAPLDSGADTIVVGLFEGKGIPHDLPDGSLQALVDSGEAKPGYKKLAVAHGEGKRWILIGLGKRDEFDLERARVAAAVAHGRARELGTRALCWELPHKVEDDTAAALVEGTVMAAYRFSAYKRPDDEDGLEELVVSAHHDVAEPTERGRVIAEATSFTRDLQNLAANDKTPSVLAAKARELAEELGLEVDVLGREQIKAAGMGAFACVAQGSAEEPALITLRYDGEDATGPVIGLVGKAVTFDTGGISIKPAKGMSEMKFDMSGGASVMGAIGAIARLKLPVRVIGVIGATENMPSGNAVKPGDVVKAKTGLTIEVINTDAEGRLVLCDCLAHAIDCGAERIVDIATLTGGIITALGSHYAGLFGNDDAWCEAVTAAGARTGEPLWRLPLHPEYAKALDGRYADLQNVNEDRKATSIVGAEFLHRFVGDVPWVHLDIAGVAWNRGTEYAPKGGNAFGMRLFVELARAHGAANAAR
jgi:leucyl aminopeptidase